MTEDEFVLATNLEDIKFAKYAIGEILVTPRPSPAGLTAEDKQTIVVMLMNAERNIYKAIQLEVTDE